MTNMLLKIQADQGTGKTVQTPAVEPVEVPDSKAGEYTSLTSRKAF